MNAYSSRILDLFGIKVPVIQTPMLGITTSAMIVAVAEAGGVGSLPLSNVSRERGLELIFRDKTTDIQAHQCKFSLP